MIEQLLLDPAFLSLFLSIPVGVSFFLILTRGIQAHLRSLGEYLRFFFWPFSPLRMLIIRELDGGIRCFYDDEFEEIYSRDMTYLRCVDGSTYITKKPPSQTAVNVSLFDARAPAKTPSPFSLAWRWCVAAAIFVYFVYYALIDSWLAKEFVWQKAMISTIAFLLSFIWMMTNVMRMNDEVIKYAIYHSIGINPPHEVIVPSLEASNLKLVDYLELLGKKIEIIVPSELQDLLNQVTKKVGSQSLAAIILSRLHMIQTWRQASTLILKEKFDLRKLGETAALIRMREFAPTRKALAMILVFVIGLGVGLAIGYVIGQSISVEVSPPEVTTHQQAQGQQQPSPQIIPAQPPAPPINKTSPPPGGG